MALSLADELAAFDDPPNGVGGGLSLAEEFGLDLGDEPGDDKFGSHDHDTSSRNDDPSFSGPHAGNHTGSPRQSSLPLPVNPLAVDQNGRRTAKSSSSTTFGTAASQSAFDGTDVDGMLDTSLGETSYQTALMDLSPAQSPGRNVARAPGAIPALDGDGHSREQTTSFLGHRIEKDAVFELQEILESNRPFLDLVTRLDEGVSTRTPTQKPRESKEPIEVLLQRHLERLHDEDKTREDQCRELASLAREVSTFVWDDNIELQIATGEGLGLGMIDEVEDPAEGDADVGWNGDLAAAFGASSKDDGDVRSDRAATPGFEDDRDRLLGPPSPLVSSASLPPFARANSATFQNLAPLPKTARLLTTTTPDLLSTFASLADTLQSTTSFSTSLSRHLRGIRAGIDSWKDRDQQEDIARRGVEEFERKRLEAGLKGKPRETAKAMLEKEMQGFESVLNGLQSRMDKLSKEPALRWALR